MDSCSTLYSHVCLFFTGIPKWLDPNPPLSKLVAGKTTEFPCSSVDTFVITLLDSDSTGTNMCKLYLKWHFHFQSLWMSKLHFNWEKKVGVCVGGGGMHFSVPAQNGAVEACQIGDGGQLRLLWKPTSWTRHFEHLSFFSINSFQTPCV